MSADADREQGFALIGAMWLLLLGGTIAALLLLRAQAANKDADKQARILVGRMAAESAVQTVAAEILLLGPNSRWARAPARGTIDVDGTAVEVELTDETSRIDINTVDLHALDSALTSMDLSRGEAGRLITAIQHAREAGRKLASLAEVTSFVGANSRSSACLTNVMTLYSGNGRPSSYSNQGEPFGTNSSTPMIGTALRLHAVTGELSSKFAVIRVASLADTPLAVHAWGSGSLCQAGSAVSQGESSSILDQ